MEILKKKKIGFLGATFDPIHKGHTEIANIAKKRFMLDEVWFVPNKNPYYKKQPVANTHHRLAMLKIAIKTERNFKIYKEEIKNIKYTYTVDSLKKIKNQNQDSQIMLIIGMDSFNSIQSWKDYREIIKYADIRRLIF